MTRNSYSYAPTIVYNVHKTISSEASAEFILAVVHASGLSSFYFSPDPKYNDSNRSTILLL